MPRITRISTNNVREDGYSNEQLRTKRTEEV